LIAMLGRDPGIDVVATAEDGADMLDKARALRPDVVVLDLQMPGMSGMTALCRLTAELPGVRVLVLTAAVDPELVVDAASRAAAGELARRARRPAVRTSDGGDRRLLVRAHEAVDERIVRHGLETDPLLVYVRVVHAPWSRAREGAPIRTPRGFSAGNAYRN